MVPAAQGAECSSAANISQGTNVKNQEWKTHPLCFCWALLHPKQPRKCMMETTRCLPGQGTFFQAKSLEERLFCFTSFLRVSCLRHSLSLCNHQFIYPPQMMLPQLYCASWPIAVEKCGHHMLAAIESWAHFFSAQPLSCGNHFKGNHSPYNMLVI